jgi:Inositol polyphosphate kinase
MKNLSLPKKSDERSSHPLEWSHLDDAHLLLQDLTINYSKPCVMDLKMGVQTYVRSHHQSFFNFCRCFSQVVFFCCHDILQEPDATPEKRAREYGKYPQQTKFGFRIVGMRYYNPSHADADEKGFLYFEKSYGRSLTTYEQLTEAFRLYFGAGCHDMSQPSDSNADPMEADGTQEELSNAKHRSNGHANSPAKLCQPQSVNRPNGMIRRRTVSNFLLQLRPLRRWFEENQSLRFYASSLLLIYEGDVENSPNPDMVTLKMIDFGRVRREAGGDQGYITGLSTVRNIFEELLIEDEKRAATPCC